MPLGDLDVRTADTLSAVQEILAQFLVETYGAWPEKIEPSCHLTDLAVNSVQLLQVHARLEDTFGIEIAASALFDHDTVGALAEYLAGCR
jgi:acyl carrier protein